MAGTKSGGYYLLSREFSRDPEAAKTLAENVGKALTALSSAREGGRGNTALAVFAAEISGNPHYFDRGSTAGQLLTDALCCVMGRRQPENTHQWKELLLEAGIAPDYVSSFVHICGICLETEEGEHPAFRAFRERGEPCAVTLENLKKVVRARVPGKRFLLWRTKWSSAF